MTMITRRGAIAGLGAALAVGPGAARGRQHNSRQTGFTLIKYKSAEAGTYARSAAQLAAVGGAGEWNVMHWVDPALDARIIAGTNTTDLNSYFRNALRAVAGHSGPRRLHLPALQFRIDTTLRVEVSDLIIDAPGAKIVSALSASDPIIYITPAGDRVTINGLHTVSTGGALPHHYTVYGAGCRMVGVTIEDMPDANGQQLYVRFGANGFRFINSRMTGNNAAIYIEASDFLIQGNRFMGSDRFNGDDCVAIKAAAGAVSNGTIADNYVRRYANIVGIGSEIGTLRAADPTYSKRVSNIAITGNRAEKCAYGLLVKPGAMEADYRDGLVENVTYSNNSLHDPAGDSFQRGIAITAARGAIVRNVTGSNNLIVARASGDSRTGHKTAFDLFYTGSGAAPTFDTVSVGFTFRDPYAGGAFGTPGTSGYPVRHIVNIEPDGAAIRRIDVRAEGDGCAGSGIVVHEGAGESVTVSHARLKNINANGGPGAGIEVKTGSTVRVSDDVSVEMVAGDKYRARGTGRILPVRPNPR